MTEPWCWTAAEVAELTDFQVLEIRRRQADKVQAMTTATAPPGAADDRAESDLPFCDRETAIDFMVGVQGKTREQAEADYDRAARRG